MQSIGRMVRMTGAAALVIALAGGCASIKDHRGYLIDQALIDSVQPGVDNKMSVEREMSVFEQVLIPLIRDRDPQRSQQVEATLQELVQLGDELREMLLARASRPFH